MFSRAISCSLEVRLAHLQRELAWHVLSQRIGPPHLEFGAGPALDAAIVCLQYLEVDAHRVILKGAQTGSFYPWFEGH